MLFPEVRNLFEEKKLQEKHTEALLEIMKHYNDPLVLVWDPQMFSVALAKIIPEELFEIKEPAGIVNYLEKKRKDAHEKILSLSKDYSGDAPENRQFIRAALLEQDILRAVSFWISSSAAEPKEILQKIKILKEITSAFRSEAEQEKHYPLDSDSTLVPYL
jgi:predicted component of viral defense system (DUF524 family)